jgi:large subunit ribosomal protein L6
MSKIGRKPITIPSGVTVTITDGVATVVGPKATMSYALMEGIEAKVADNMITVSETNPENETAAAFGLVRSLIANMVHGVSTGFEKKLEMTGVGYRAQASGTDLTISVGFSHPVKMKAPQGVTFSVAENVITVAGHDKMVIGDIAAKIRAIRPPEPYKGKGIKYVGERIRRKVGKAAKAVGGK